jgi:hypothetical protein
MVELARAMALDLAIRRGLLSMTYSTPELVLVGQAQNLVLLTSLEYHKNDFCCPANYPSDIDFAWGYDYIESW